MRLKEHGPPQLCLHRQYRRIEAFQMAGLQDALVLTRDIEEFVGLRKRRRDWLFDKHIKTGVKQRRRCRVMVHCGNGNRSRVEIKIGSQQFFNGSENRDAEFLFCLGRVRGIRIDRRDKGNSLTGRFQFAIDTKVIAAEGAAADHGNP